MTLGTANKYSLYIVKAANAPPDAEGDYTNYTANLTAFKVVQGINKLDYFEAKLVGIRTDAQRLDVAKGNYAYVYSGTTQISAFVIEQPEYDSTSYVATIKGYESTGTKTKPRQLKNEVTPRTKYENVTVTNLVSSLSKDASGNCITCVDSTNSGGAETITYSADYTNKIKAIGEIANVACKEWWFEHDATGGKGDELNVNDMKGTTTPPYTFYMLSASNNAKVGKYDNDASSIVNRAVVTGQDIHSVQSEADIYDASVSKSYTTCAIDNWLSADIDDADTSFTFTNSNSQIGAGVHCFMVDRECIKGTISGTAVSSATRGWNKTSPTCHKKGSDVVSDNGFAEVWVADTTQFANGDCIRVGSELFKITAGVVACLQVTREAETDTNPWYAHDLCAPVYVYKRSGTTYSPDSADANSSIGLYGVKTCKLSSNGIVRRHDLDMVGYNQLKAKSAPVKKITIIPSKPHAVIAALTPGDYACLCAATTNMNISNMKGRVGGWDLSYETGRDKLEVYFTDTTYKAYDLQPQTSFADKEKDRTKTEQQDPTRQFQTDRSITEDDDMTLSPIGNVKVEADLHICGNQIFGNRNSANPGCHLMMFCGTGTNELQFGYTSPATSLIVDFTLGTCICGVTDPVNDYDAANKKYVDCCGGGSSLWDASTGGYICPKDTCMVLTPGICVDGNILSDGTDIYLNKAGPDGNQAINFYENSAIDGATLQWCNAGGYFRFNQPLRGAYTICAETELIAPVVCSSGTACVGTCLCVGGCLVVGTDICTTGDQYFNASNQNAYIYFYEDSATGAYMKWCTSEYFLFSHQVCASDFSTDGGVCADSGTLRGKYGCICCGCYTGKFRLPVGSNRY